MMATAPFCVITAVIRKMELRHLSNDKVYETAMDFGLERLSDHLAEKGQCGTTTHVVFEKRGNAEDKSLELSFRRIAPDYAKKTGALLEIKFASKSANHCGLQIADLTARPIALSVFRPTQENRAMDVIRPKLRRSKTGDFLGYGLKIFP